MNSPEKPEQLSLSNPCIWYTYNELQGLHFWASSTLKEMQIQIVSMSLLFQDGFVVGLPRDAACVKDESCWLRVDFGAGADETDGGSNSSSGFGQLVR